VDERPSFDEYLATLGHLTAHVDPTATTPLSVAIKTAAESLSALEDVSATTLAAWAQEHAEHAGALGLAVGLGLEKFRMTLRHHFGTSGWVTLARHRPVELIGMLDQHYDLVRQLAIQRRKTYDFGDILVARAGGRVTATRASKSGRRLEDAIEAIARELGLAYETRTRFEGRRGHAPADLVVPSRENALIAVAAKGFDSTGSKLTDSVREIEEMAAIRLPRQYIMAVIDGIGWKSRVADLRRIYSLWERQEIDGMYSLASMDRFRADLAEAARLRGLLPGSK